MENELKINLNDQEKDLLLKDLCGRLPYGVIIKHGCDSSKLDTIFMCDSISISSTSIDKKLSYNLDLDEVKPYLYPLSSMTKEQREKFNSFFVSVPYYGDNEHEHVVPYYFVELLIEFFHENHIDNNGLIPKGLAIDATGLNIY